MVNDRAAIGQFGGLGVARTMLGKVDVCNVKLTSTNQVDNDLLKFHMVGGAQDGAKF